MTRRRSALVGLALLSVAALPLGAQETRCERGDVQVDKLEFRGNTAFNDATLLAGIVTTPSSWLRRTFRFVGARHCLDAREFPDDLRRLEVWYRNHGFTDATVDTVVTPTGPNRVSVRFNIVEGEPVVIDTLRLIGLDAVPERAELIRDLPVRSGGRFDRYANSAMRDTLTRRFRDNGYPDAETFLGYDTRTLSRTATVIFTVVPGPRRRIGEVRLTRAGRDGRPPEVTAAAVRRLAGLNEGDLYRERNLERAKRTLYQSEAFSQVEVQPGLARADSTLAVEVDVTEGYLRSARLGGGWGTLDCFRTTGELTEYNLFKTATRLELRGRVSKIGMGAPLDGAEQLCSNTARSDPYSVDLNYYTSATLSQPSLLRASFVPTLSLYSERRSEYQAFLRTTPVGASLQASRALPRRTHSVGYSIEFGRTEAQPALFCAVFDACVEADRNALQRLQRLAVVSAGSSYERTDNAADPTRGLTGRAELRYAARSLGSEQGLQFARMSVDGALYRALGSDMVLATRVRVGVVLDAKFSFDDTDNFVPAQERLFAGGPTTVRGFRQNELGPSVYIPASYEIFDATSGARLDSLAPGQSGYFRAADTLSQRPVPTGGNALVVANVELRIVSPFLPELLKWTVFADAGRVWNRGAGTERLQFKEIRVTPGVGVRIRTPVGYLRVDVAYNGYPRAPGAAYFNAPAREGGSLYCVSPGNTLLATRTGNIITQAAGVCPGDFQPPRSANFFSRLTPMFAIGQAF